MEEKGKGGKKKRYGNDKKKASKREYKRILRWEEKEKAGEKMVLERERNARG